MTRDELEEFLLNLTGPDHDEAQDTALTLVGIERASRQL